MLAHVALPSCQIEGVYWAGERGLLSTAQVQCGKNVGFDVFGLFLNIFLYCCLRLQSYEKISRLQNVKERMYVKPLNETTF